MEKIKFFSETFKVLLAMTISVWAIFIMFILFADNQVCGSGGSGRFFTMLSWLAGVMTAPPLIYGLYRLLFPKGGPKVKDSLFSVWALVIGSALFVAVSILFAAVLSKYGCS